MSPVESWHSVLLTPILSGHPTADPRGEYIDTEIWPTWISASHGHNKNIAEHIGDSDIAMAWLTNEEREALGPTAAYQGRPYLAKGEYPPRLYHRTMHDAAFASLEGGFQPGFGNTGKFHSYFDKATLTELENQAGSRANLPYEIVVSTDGALDHAYLFETTSDGILTRADPNDTEEVVAADAPPLAILKKLTGFSQKLWKAIQPR